MPIRLEPHRRAKVASKLEPFREFILELRQPQPMPTPYSVIANILKARYGLTVNPGSIHDFLRVRGLLKREHRSSGKKASGAYFQPKSDRHGKRVPQIEAAGRRVNQEAAQREAQKENEPLHLITTADLHYLTDEEIQQRKAK
jgi:hypothetical protein